MSSVLPPVRLIPAHAGKTFTCPLRLVRGRAHPRSRGENGSHVLACHWFSGSSPLTRGKHASLCGKTCKERLIPAHAGKTQGAWERDAHHTAHPRSRGENCPPTRIRLLSAGSSPLTRGKRGRARPILPGRLAHPRSRGENSDPAYGMALSVGSSPLTRGKPVSRQVSSSSTGLIPAHAGKTHHTGDPLERTRAHPRSRGENVRSATRLLAICGSSPLTRGKRYTPRPGAPERRLIPAHAGKTAGSAAPTSWVSAHPRSRGENASNRLSQISAGGSSPLTRGKRPASAYLVFIAGLIPAHAGKTSRRHSGISTEPAHPRSRGENSLSGLE